MSDEQVRVFMPFALLVALVVFIAMRSLD